MIFESEFFILTLLVVSVTAVGWWLFSGPSFALADLTTVEPRAKSGISKSPQKAGHVPVLLPVNTVPESTGLPFTGPEQSVPRAGTMPLDTQTQLNRVSNILQSAIDLAANAERLHNAAQEQLDSAHYALQNLLDELSAVMPITSPSKMVKRDTAPAQYFAADRPAYVTALAA